MSEAILTSWNEDDLRSFRLLGPDDGRTELGEGRLPAQLLLGEPRFLDGYGFRWAMALMQLHRDPATELFDMEAADGVPARSDPYPMPVLIISLPDYPSDETVSYVLPLIDAKAFVSKLSAEIRDAEREIGKVVRAAERQHQRSRPVVDRTVRAAVECSVEGCHRQRKFFDQDGHGYCGRHAEEHGVRDHGKV